MCKTPVREVLLPAVPPGSLAASWTRPGDPRSALDGSQRQACSSRSRVLLALAVFAGEGSRDDALATVGVAALLVAAVALAAAARGFLPLRRLDGPGRRRRRRRVALDRLGGRLDRLVDRRRPLVGLARPRARLRRVPRARAARRRPRGRSAPGRRGRRGRRRGRARLGAARSRRPSPSSRTAIAIARLREPVGYWNALALLADAGLALGLWLARAPGGSSFASGGCCSSTGRPSRCSSPSRGPVSSARSRYSRSGSCSRRRAWPTASASLVAGLPGARGRRLGLHPPRARRGRCAPRRPRRRRSQLRCARARRSPRRRARGLAASAVEARRRARAGACAGRSSRRASSCSSSSSSVSSPRWGIPSRGRRSSSPARSARTTQGGSRISARTTAPPGGGSPFASPPTSRSAARGREPSSSRGSDFERTRAPSVEPHSVPLQLLADLGVVGLALGLLLVGGAIVGVRRGLRLAEPSERPATAALACLVLAYAVHALVDYDLDFLAVTAPMLVALGAVLAVGRPLGDPAARRARPRRGAGRPPPPRSPPSRCRRSPSATWIAR